VPVPNPRFQGASSAVLQHEERRLALEIVTQEADDTRVALQAFENPSFSLQTPQVFRLAL
jgi:hypothetical protein